MNTTPEPNAVPRTPARTSPTTIWPDQDPVAAKARRKVKAALFITGAVVWGLILALPLLLPGNPRFQFVYRTEWVLGIPVAVVLAAALTSAWREAARVEASHPDHQGRH